MKMDLSYVPEKVCLRQSLKGQADWIITRILLLKLVPAWIEKLKSFELELELPL